MNLYYMTTPTKYCRVKFECTTVYHQLVLYYHAHCSIAYLACCADKACIVISCDSEVKKMLDRTRKRVEDGRERDRSGGTGKGE